MSVYVGVVLACAAGGAQGSAIILVIDPSFGSTESTGATARLSLSFTEDGLNDLLHVLIENTTPGSIGSSLTAVGFEVPDSWPATFASGGTGTFFDELDLDVAISPGWLSAPGGYDVMITSDHNFEGGSPQGAPTEGESESIVLNLGNTGSTPDQLVTLFTTYYAGLEGYYAVGRFQAVGPGGELSDKVAGNAPEPGTLLLLGCGGLAALRRRSKAVR
ncbi:MAG: PEP-CTERM sorting domain-containing protein [Planctomycetota bacterium]